MKRIKSDIAKKNFEKCYLLDGGESFLRDLYVKRLKNAVAGGSFSEMNTDVFNGAVDINRIIDASETIPFMSDKRLLIIKDSGLFKAGRKNDSERIAQMIENLPESTCVVFSEEEADKRLRLFKAVVKCGYAALCAAPQGNELYIWAEKMLAKNKIKMDRAQTLFFFKTVGYSMENAAAELNKLISYKGADTVVENADIEKVCVKAMEAHIFDLVEAIGKRETDKAVKIYRNLISLKEQPIGILAMIARQFRLMIEAAGLTNSGKSQREVCELMGQKDFVVKMALSQSRNFTPDTLKAAFKDCLNTDYGIKSGMLQDETAVEILIVKYSG